MRVSYSPFYYAQIPEKHVFPMRKFALLKDLLIKNQIVAASEIMEPSPASESTLRLVHTSRYLDAILRGVIDKKEERKLGLPWTPSLAQRSCYAVQGTINAALMALEDGIAGNLAGGTHHAFPDSGEGFCVFNDVAVAIRLLLRSLWMRAALIFDCDVHQGNGSAHIFSDDGNVFTCSVHGQHNFPFRKEQSNLDVGLFDKTGDIEYLEIVELALERVGQEFRPDIVFYLGGVDVLSTDRFGRLSLSFDGLRQRDRLVIDFFTRQEIPLVLLLSGGYAPTPLQTAQAHAVMFEEAVHTANLHQI